MLLLLSLLTLQACSTKFQPLPGFETTSQFGEQVRTFTNDFGVRIHVNAPASDKLARHNDVTLVFYGLPNGNTIEQTVGRKIKEGDDWHFDIQHIGAQTRFLRNVITNESLVVAYLENDLKSWPAWRKKHGDQEIPKILASVTKLFGGSVKKTILTGHSGGGSLTFGYLNTVETIPRDIHRIGFLDSNYAYETSLHRDKLIQWLKDSEQHSLLIFAYHDDVALLNGKTFVSASGGTWGRSHLMRKDFESEFSFREDTMDEIKTWSARNNRLRFFLKENPEKKIYHTVQVERNGFIHLVLAGTPHENIGYQYFGSRAYTNHIGD
ncbi:MAG: hypothetical protein H0X66_11135 [Verrucomicrobia bacterium]|nr:hypothetical protein [Verrucomicrobiota bacterium]